MRVENVLYKNQGIHVISSIFTVDNGKVKVLLLKRRNEPYKDYWALVGGALYNNESIEDGIRREIYEKSGLKDVKLYESGVFDEIGKTPTINMRMVALGYLGLVNKNANNLNNNDVEWFDINEVPDLAFLHNDMIKVSLENLRELIIQSDILKVLLPNEFTMPELQKIFEAILGKTFDRRNFRKKILSLNIVDDTNKEISINGNKPSKLYKFKKNLEKKKVF
jgi:8-oxo-dGTP diphosphatase